MHTQTLYMCTHKNKAMPASESASWGRTTVVTPQVPIDVVGMIPGDQVSIYIAEVMLIKFLAQGSNTNST